MFVIRVQSVFKYCSYTKHGSTLSGKSHVILPLYTAAACGFSSRLQVTFTIEFGHIVSEFMSIKSRQSLSTIDDART